MKNWRIEMIGDKRYHKIFHKCFTTIGKIKKLIVKFVVWSLIGFMGFASVIGLTGIVAPIIEPALRRLRESIADVQDRKHGIVYHDAEVKYTTEQMREIIKFKGKEWQMLKDELIETIETYHFFADGKIINLRRPPEDADFYDIEKFEYIKKEGTIADELWIYLKHKYFNPGDIVGQTSWIEEGYKTMSAKVLNGLQDQSLKRKLREKTEGVSILEQAIREFISLKRPSTEKKERQYMTQEDYKQTLKDIDTHLLTTEQIYS